MTRILALTNWYPPHHLGGYELLCMDVMEGLARRGHHVEVLCSDEQLSGVTEAASSPVLVHRRLKMYWRDDQPWTPSLRSQLQIERFNHERLRELVDEIAPEVVSVWHMAGVSLGLLSELHRRRVPMVYGVCDDWLIYGVDLDPWSRRWQKDPVRRCIGALVERVGGPPAILGDLGATDCFCFISSFTRRRAEKGSRWRFGVAPVVPAGIEASAFPAPGTGTPEPWAWRLAYVGRYDSRKGTDTLLRAMPQLPRAATLGMYGRGGQGEVTRLKALSAHLGIADRVQFASLDRSELAEAYVRSDCLVFPSEWPEPFGLVPLEAMACGTPVVATGAGGSAEFLVDGANCLLFTPGDPSSLAEALLRMAADPGLRARVREGGWQTSAGLTVDQMAESYEAWHLRAAEGRLLACWDSMPAGRRGGTDTAVDPEVPSTVLPRTALHGARGAVLIVSSHHLVVPEGLVNPAVVLVSDVARGRAVRMVGESAGLDPMKVHPVVGTPSAMPFRRVSLSGGVFELGPGTTDADRAVSGELHRVLGWGSPVAVVGRNRYDAAKAAARLAERWRGVRRSRPDEPDSPGADSVTWSQFPRILSPELQLVRRVAIGWPTSVRGRRASRLLRGPLRRFGRMVVVEARTR